jgi:ABC-2 type transport system permease protein
MKGVLRAAALIAWRDLLRFLRQRGRIWGAVLAPLVILIFFGAAAESMMRAGEVYRKFLLAGMVVQAMIFSASASASTLIWDREAGLLRVLALAPVPTEGLALGKVGGSALQALLHGLLFLLAAPLVGVWMHPVELLGAAGVCVLIALPLSAICLLLASRTRSPEELNLWLLWVSIPMLFVSGVHFPVMEFPPWLAALARINPATYGIDALKHLLVPAEEAGRFVPDFPLALDLLVLSIFALVTLAACVRSMRLLPR